MTSNQSPLLAGHPGQPGPAGNFDQSYPPLGPDFVIPPEEDYSDQNPPPPPSSLTSEMYSTSYPANPTRHELKKFYSLLMTYLLLIFGIFSFIVVHEPTKLFVNSNHQWLIAAVFGTAAITHIGFTTCLSSGRRESPIMWIFPLIDAGAFGISQSLIFAELPRDELLLVYGFGITSVVFFSLTLLAFWIKLDLTRLHTVLFVCAIGLLIFGIVIICLPSYIDFFIFCPLGEILLSFYFIYDTPTFINYQHKYSISPKENKNNQSIECNKELSKKFIYN